MLNEAFGLNNIEIQGDSWGAAVKREPRVVYIRVFMAGYA